MRRQWPENSRRGERGRTENAVSRLGVLRESGSLRRDNVVACDLPPTAIRSFPCPARSAQDGIEYGIEYEGRSPSVVTS